MHNIQNNKYNETHVNSLPDASNHCPSSFSAQIPKRPHSSTSLSMGMATVIMTVVGGRTLPFICYYIQKRPFSG